MFIDNDLFSNIALTSAAVVPIIVALIQVVKMTNLLKDRYAPIASIVLGIILAFLVVRDDTLTWGNIIMSGILFGLSASSLYSGTLSMRNTIKADRMKEDKIKRDRF